MNWHDSIESALVTFLIVGGSVTGIFASSVQERVFSIILGLGVAVCLNLFFPPRHSHRVIGKIRETADDMDDFICRSFDSLVREMDSSAEEEKNDVLRLRGEIEKTRSLYVLLVESRLRKDWANLEVVKLRKAINSLQADLERIVEIRRNIVFIKEDDPSGNSWTEIKKPVYGFLSDLRQLHKDVYGAFNSGGMVPMDFFDDIYVEGEEIKDAILERLREEPSDMLLKYYNIVYQGQRISRKLKDFGAACS